MSDISTTLTPHLGRTISIGKCPIMSQLQMLLQSRRLHLPVTSEDPALARELQDYQISISERGHASFSARLGAYEHLVIALGRSVEGPAAGATSRSYPNHGPSLEEAARMHGLRRRLGKTPQRFDAYSLGPVQCYLQLGSSVH